MNYVITSFIIYLVIDIVYYLLEKKRITNIKKYVFGSSHPNKDMMINFIKDNIANGFSLDVPEIITVYNKNSKRCITCYDILFFIRTFFGIYDIESKDTMKELYDIVKIECDNNNIEIDNMDIFYNNYSNIHDIKLYIGLGVYRPVIYYRPIIIGVLINTIRYFVNYYYKQYNNWKLYIDPVQITDLRYMIKINKSHKKTIIFFHGIGIGLFPYMHIMEILSNKYNMICLEFPGLNGDSLLIPKLEDIHLSVYNVLRKNKLYDTHIYVFGHSYGTDIASSFINHSNPFTHLYKINGIILLQPICFFHKIFDSHQLPVLSYNEYLDHLQVSNFNLIANFSYTFIIHHISNQQASFRTLYGGGLACFTNKKINGIVIVSDNDYVMDSKEIHRYIKSYFTNLQAIMIKDSTHCDFLFNKTKMENIIYKIINYIESNIT
jgi:pimeloyl-ACP methyl ester carboxylesterase